MNLKYLAWVAIAILAVFLFLRFFDWIDDTQRSLLPQTSALAILDDLSSLENIVPLPAQTFGAELSIAGLYTLDTGEFSEGTVVVVFVKDDWRFVEIDYFPSLTATGISRHPHLSHTGNKARPRTNRLAPDDRQQPALH